MTKPATTPHRITRTMVASAIGALFCCTCPSGAFAAGSSANPTSGASALSTAAGSQAELETRAEELASQIQVDGVQLDRLSGEYEAAQIHLSALDSQEVALRATVSTTRSQVAVIRRSLKEQAVMAYLAGGAPVIAQLPDQPGSDPSLTASYAEIVAGSEQSDMADLRSTLTEEATQEAQISSDERAAAVTVADLRADQQSANTTLNSQKQTLAQVKGQLAVMVAQIQAASSGQDQVAAQITTSADGPVPTAVSPSSAGPVTTSSTTKAAPGPTTPATRTAAPSVTTTTVPPRSASPTAPPRPTTTEAPTTEAPTTSTTSAPTTVVTAPVSNTPAPGSATAIAYAEAQIGKPYQWGGAGPQSFDCSGLVMMAWAQAGVQFPHLAQDQYEMTERVPLSDLLPGDLVFYGSPSDAYHVGIYVGGGDMVDAPTTGQDVMIQSIYYGGLFAGGRVVG